MRRRSRICQDFLRPFIPFNYNPTPILLIYKYVHIVFIKFDLWAIQFHRFCSLHQRLNIRLYCHGSDVSEHSEYSI